MGESEEEQHVSNYDKFELQNPERAEAIAAVEQQIEEWGLAMPKITPIPLDFGLKRFYEIGETEFWIANETELGYCGKFLFVFDHQTCPKHYHKIKHETFFVMKGSIYMAVDDSEHIMWAGDTLAMPPGKAHSFTGIGPALILEVSMPSIMRDNFFEDHAIGDDGVI